MKEFFKLAKLKIVLAGIFLVAVYFVVNFYGLHTFVGSIVPIEPFV